MAGGEIIGLVSAVLIFSIPISAIWAGALKERYRAQQSVLSDDERKRLHELTIIAERMSQRIETLESILDAEMPEWREDDERS